MSSFKLIQGKFSANDAIDIITQMVQVKIKFHESKITNTSNEEDSKLEEKRIKELQNELQNLRSNILSKGELVELSSVINYQ
jgi:hypothetical protein